MIKLKIKLIRQKDAKLKITIKKNYKTKLPLNKLA